MTEQAVPDSALAHLSQTRCGPGPLPTLSPRPASPFPILSASSPPFHVPGEPGLCAPGALSEFPSRLGLLDPQAEGALPGTRKRLRQRE